MGEKVKLKLTGPSAGSTIYAGSMITHFYSVKVLRADMDTRQITWNIAKFYSAKVLRADTDLKRIGAEMDVKKVEKTLFWKNLKMIF